MKKRLLPLEGAYNVRGLGGYPTKDGGITKKSAFIRGDSLDQLTLGDIQFLKNIPLALDVDLRSADERNSYQDLLENQKGIQYAPISLMGAFEKHLASPSALASSQLPKSLGALYALTLEHCQDGFKAVFKQMAQAGPGAILFHCSVGKDRTGMIAALILDLAGVEESLIIEDYQYTKERIEPILETFSYKNEEHLKHFLEVDPKGMEQFLWQLKKEFVTTSNFLETIGLESAEIEGLKKRIV